MLTQRLPLFLTAALALAATGALAKPPTLKAVGNRIVDTRGQTVRLRGVNVASLEWDINGEGHILDTLRVALDDWKVNHVRVPLSQDRWFGKTPEQKDGGKAYRALAKKIVDYCSDRNVYVVLDLHWSNAGVWGQQIGQHAMPDQNSVAFWKDCARTYRNHPAVLFDLYNEPHDVTWDIWLKGGSVTERDRGRNFTNTFEAVGMQTLLDTVRATGAKNLVIAGGLDWSYDLSGILDGRALADPKGNGVLYANHAYPFKGDTVERWIGKMERATATLPVIVSEFGSEPSRGQGPEVSETWVRHVLSALEGRGWNWTAWDLHPSAGPRLVSDWNYTPTPYFGVPVRQALLGALPPFVPPAPAPAPVAKEYPLGPDSLVKPDVPHGKLEGPFLLKSKVYEGTVHKYWVYVPTGYDPSKPPALLVFQDGQRAINPNGVIRVQNVLDNLIARKEIPVTLGVFVTPGQRGDEYPESLGIQNPNNRSVEYDSMGDAYARFVVDELLPEVGKTWKFTDTPAGRAIGGFSSGAIAAFTVAWERPDAFRNVISAIGSFTNIRGGHVYPELVRTTPAKPIRVFLQDGSLDNRNPNNPQRDWHLQNQAMAAALKEKGYDLNVVFGEGNHSDNHGGAILPDILRWIWRDYPR